ncbi:molybdopterin-dependent oxidoreductase [Dehalobacter sp. DCM]|uniref:molybdopterin-dependent oxidoreductase n=1 Tax=Dehalobacter sp. DCM TaxID=2907827 RepID=UPI0030812D95|nr:molybdopterin-dependent oxidoreductase [Dehalobacter sp. DCM]
MKYNNAYNFDLYPKTLRWQEGDLTATRTTMWSGPGCHNGCQLIFYTDKDGKLVKVEGDPNSPYNQGRLCLRCLELPEITNHQDRLKWPLKRVGERGENKWERISWDEAYDIIAENVRKFQKETGPESIVSMMGTGRNVSQALGQNQYANFGGPDVCLAFLSGDSCMNPRVALCYVMMGNINVADMSQFRENRYEDDSEWAAPENIIVWGNNPVVSNSDCFLGHWIVESMKRGSKLTVVDPKLTWMAAKADTWLRIRPGTDAALALGMLNVIINEDLYDHDFVEKWTHGFEELKACVQEYTPERMAEICWINKHDLVDAARTYANAKPGCIQWGLAVDQSKIGISTAQAIMCLVGICGNLDIPGGNVLIDQSANLNFSYGCGIDTLEPGMREKRLGDDKFILKTYGFGSTSQSDSVLEAIETGLPHPVRMLWLQSANPIANMAQDAPRVYKAIKSMEFVVVIDLFMTPTAVALADLVLPAAMSHERDCIRVWYDPLRTLSKCGTYYEAKEDEQIGIDLGKRLAPHKWPEWVNTTRDFMNWKLQEGGVPWTMEEIEAEGGMIYHPFNYKKYEKGLCRMDGEPGFNTPTGKFELFITVFEAFGNVAPSLPYWEEPPESPYSTPELFKEYPLVLTTGHRSFEFFHSEHRNSKTSRELHANPLFDIHPEAAEKFGITEGQWCWIENRMGRFRQIARFDITLDPRVIRAEHGWWFPEKEAAEPTLFGVFDSNPNNVIPQFEYGPTGYGAPVKSLIAKVYACTEENSKITPTEQVTKLGGFGYVK